MEEFSEHLENKYKFVFDKNENVGGGFGDVYFGSMYEENDVENKIPVVLKTCTKKAENKEQQQFKKEQFKKEQEIFKMLSELHQDDVVGCYGIAHIDDKEYIVMEDLKEQGFETVRDVYGELIKEKSGDDKSVIQRYKENLCRLYDMSSIYLDYDEKQKEEIKKHKQRYNEKFKQKEEKNQNKIKVYRMKKEYVVFLKKQNILKN